MNLTKFTLLQNKEVEPISKQNQDILININQIVSIKPINIVSSEEIQKGYWIRLTNGKKYKAIEIPFCLKELLNDSTENEYHSAQDKNLELFEELPIQ